LIEVNQRIDNLRVEMDTRYATLEYRVSDLEVRVDILEKRPVNTGTDVDTSLFVSREEFHDLLDRLKLTEKRNIE
jgi:hypothetical protein